ncbi:MAG: hypothetical protein H6R00_3303, partial [Proteobacteria bacterium]|nr:hypothetical protein [Pseudomonadota bacterium]
VQSANTIPASQSEAEGRILSELLNPVIRVVRLRHLHPPDTTLGANVGVKRTTSKLLVLAELLNLTFELAPYVSRDSNVKFAPLDAGLGPAGQRLVPNPFAVENVDAGANHDGNAD